MKRIILVSLLCVSTFLPIIAGSGSAGPVGWASVHANGQNGTTGGEGGQIVTVTNLDDLILYCSMTSPYVIRIQGMITVSPKGRHIQVVSNKTLIGMTKGSGISQGGYSVGSGQKNIIFKNLNISDTYLEGDWDGKEQDWDGIKINGTCHHIWIDHCTFLRQGDGAIDITNGADYITISYSKFSENNKVSLIGSSDSDIHTDKYKVTMHHNWFNETTQRHARVRYGMVHLFNNYYHNMGGYGRAMGYATSNGYGIGVGVGSKVYSEHNYFEKVTYPSQFYDDAGPTGYLIDIGSYFEQSGTILTNPSGVNWNPADYYYYKLNDAEMVKAIVMEYAGADATTSTVTDTERDRQFEFINYPNPYTDHTTLAFVLPSDGRVRMVLYDITGRKIHDISESHYPAGKNEVSLLREKTKPGIYIVSLEFKDWRLTRKIIIN